MFIVTVLVITTGYSVEEDRAQWSAIGDRQGQKHADDADDDTICNAIVHAVSE